ncbi:phage tail tape measure protein [Oceanihabitans sediminis]|uniref:phage tail tape measure protein n=1 Tax=Oceanihabitans sediminis TaxID=1812012 RepID=UPI00299E0556|nr:phage tail tape measure protein [Oceanihabitans sediminis]MDX1278566.1 phage tail tape measure protein [Oceanihabitans sediminis]
MTRNTRTIYDKYNNTLGEITTQTTRYKDEQGRVITNTKKIADTTQRTNGMWSTGRQSIDKMNTSLNALRWTMVNFMFAATAVIAVVGGIAKVGGEFSLALKRAEVVSGVSSENILSNLKEIRKETIFSMDEMAAAYTEFAKLGFTGDEALEALPHLANLATVGFTDLGTATAITGQIMHQFSLGMEDVEDIVDTVAKAANLSAADVGDLGNALSYVGGIAAQSGMEFEDTAAAIAILTNAGLKNTKAGTSLAAAISKMSKPTGAVKDAMRQLGVSFFDNNHEMKSMNTIIKELSESLRGYADDSRRAFLIQAFGQRGGRAIDALIEQYEEAGVTIENFKEKMDEVASSEELAGDIGEDSGARVKKAWESAVTSVKEGAKSILDAFFVVKDALTTDDTRLGSLFNKNDMGPSGGLSMVVDVVSAIKNKFSPAVEEATEKTGDFSDSLTAAAKTSDDAGKKLQLITTEVRNFLNVLDKSRLSDYEYAIKELNDEYENYIALSKENMHVTVADIEAWKQGEIVRLQAEEAVRKLTESLQEENKVLTEQKSKLSDIEKEISALSKPRFEGQLETERLMNQVDLYLKKQELASYGIVDVQGFLQDSIAKSANGYDKLLTSIEKVNNATDDSQNSYEAWKETVQEFITSTVKSGNLLGMNVTKAVDKYQTLLMSTSKFGDDTQEQADYTSLLRDAYDVHYGAMIDDVDYAIKKHEEAGQTIYSTSDDVVRGLEKQWEAHDVLTYAIDKTEDKIDSISLEIDKAASQWELYKEHIDDVTISLSMLETQLSDVEKASTSLGAFEDYLGNKNTGTSSSRSGPIRDFSGGVVTYPSSTAPSLSFDAFENYLNTGGDLGMSIAKYNDFIMRPGESPIGFSKDDTIVGYKGDSPFGGGVTIQNVTISGVSGDADEFAYEFSKAVRRELRTI